MNGARLYTIGCVPLTSSCHFCASLTLPHSQIDSTGQTNSIMTFYELTEPGTNKGESARHSWSWFKLILHHFVYLQISQTCLLAC